MELQIQTARIAEQLTNQGSAIERVETKVDRLDTRLNDALFREEYERRHKEVENRVAEAEKRAEIAEKKASELETGTRVWRFVFSAVIAILAVVIAVFR